MPKGIIGQRFHYDHCFISRPIQLDTLRLFQIGELCLEPGFEVGIHNQYCCEISYIISGKGRFQWNDEVLEVTAGDVVITPGVGKHTIRASDTDALFFSYMGFNFNNRCDKFGPEILACYQMAKQQCCRDKNEIYTCFRRGIDEFYRTPEGSQLIVDACLTQIIVWTYRNLIHAVQDPKYQTNVQNPGVLVYRIMRHIEQNVEKSLAVNAIAESVGYSVYYISHVFKEKTGETLQGYVSRCKIEKAKELMALNRFSLTEISEKLSYHNIQSFSRAFRKQTGFSPTEYIKQQNL